MESCLVHLKNCSSKFILLSSLLESCLYLQSWLFSHYNSIDWFSVWLLCIFYSHRLLKFEYWCICCDVPFLIIRDREKSVIDPSVEYVDVDSFRASSRSNVKSGSDFGDSSSFDSTALLHGQESTDTSITEYTALGIKDSLLKEVTSPLNPLVYIEIILC